MLDINFKKMRKYLLAGLLAFAFSSILCATDSYAAFETLTETGSEIFEGMKKVIFAAAGFGIIAVALGGIFGVLNWKWLAAIIIGVVVIAATGGLLNYMTAGTGADTSVKGITDTLVNAMPYPER
ncbi:MAG: hypothetical protein IJ870_00960 [Alphaproteobacteria bacterium]|nr:hypothetical protein [Alphaproteobacteria bacterium]